MGDARKEVSSCLNELQTNPNYKNNEAGDSYKDPNPKPPSIESRLGNKFGGSKKK